MQRVLGFVFVCVGACASSTPPPQSTASATNNSGAMVATADTGASCDQAVGHMMDLLVAGKDNVPPQMVKQFHDIAATHCRSDAWSADVRGCFAGIKTLDEGDGCAAKMTEAQRNALDAEAKGPPPDAEPAAAPPPGSSPVPASTRSATPKPKKGGDPCEGGQ